MNRNRRRLLLLFLLLVVGGTGTVTFIRREAVKQELRKMRDALQRPAGPDTAMGAPSRGTLAAGDGRTLHTGDPPPFDRPTLDRSGPAITSNGRTLRPNLHFDMEHSADTTRLVRGIAHSGARSFLLRAEDEYAPAIRRQVGDVGAPLTAIGAGLWCRVDVDDPGMVIVITLHRGEEQLAWFGKELRAVEHQRGAWQRLQGELLLRDLRVEDTDVVTVYLWNKKHHDAWIDDMDVVYRSDGVLGRDSVHAHDLEDSTRTTRPLPFARVECIAALDPAVIGIRAGAQVPDMDTLVSVPGMDHRWRYRPGDGVARLVDPAGRASHLVRPWCAATGDLLGFERLHASSGETGLRLVGYDIETGPGGILRIAAHPAPRAAEIRITTP